MRRCQGPRTVHWRESGAHFSWQLIGSARRAVIGKSSGRASPFGYTLRPSIESAAGGGAVAPVSRDLLSEAGFRATGQRSIADIQLTAGWLRNRGYAGLTTHDRLLGRDLLDGDIKRRDEHE